jgi:hypothetical protein
MRRTVLIAIVAGLFAAAGVGTAGCTRDTAAVARPVGQSSAGDAPADAKEAEIYVQVLREYLDKPTESSVPRTAYVLDQASPGIGDPVKKLERGTPISPNTQQHLTAALAEVAHVAFIADPETVVEREGCAHVRDDGILIRLGTVGGDDNEVQVAVSGFQACLGAKWLTYVVRNQPASGWRVTGTTGVVVMS